MLSQRDLHHPKAGGAEKYMHHALAEVAKKREVIILSCGFKGCQSEEVIENVKVIRKGKNLLSVILYGFLYYMSNRKSIDLVIDHSNTHQFFTFLFARRKRVFFIHQLAVECWNYYYGKIGYFFRFAEDVLIKMSRGRTITVSHSTEQDLLQRGFREVHVCPEGNDIINEELPIVQKQDYLIYIGRLVPYKRVEDALDVAKGLERPIKIMGRGPKKYMDFLKQYAKIHHVDCEFMGFVSVEEKNRIISEAYFLVMPSIREGWGLVITESANLGTPSIVYPVNGVIEAVDYGKAGLIASCVDPNNMIAKLKYINHADYDKIRQNAFDFSKTIVWENTAKVFDEIIDKLIDSEAEEVVYEES